MLVVHMVSFPVLVVPTSHLVVPTSHLVVLSTPTFSPGRPEKCSPKTYISPGRAYISFGRPKDEASPLVVPIFTHGRRRMYTWPQAQPYQFLVRE